MGGYAIIQARIISRNPQCIPRRKMKIRSRLVFRHEHSVHIAEPYWTIILFLPSVPATNYTALLKKFCQPIQDMQARQEPPFTTASEQGTVRQDDSLGGCYSKKELGMTRGDNKRGGMKRSPTVALKADPFATTGDDGLRGRRKEGKGSKTTCCHRKRVSLFACYDIALFFLRHVPVRFGAHQCTPAF